MSILINKDTHVIVVGMTGREGANHTKAMREFGTQVVAGVTPGKGGQTHEGLPIYNSVAEAKAKHPVDASIIFVPPAGAADAVLESAHAGVPLVILITEGVPTVDMMRAVQEVNRLNQESLAEGRPGRAPDRRQLPRSDQQRRVQDRHHAQQHLRREGPHRPDLALRHPDLRSGQAAAKRRAGHLHHRRHRRRPGDRHDLRRRAAAVRGRPRHRRHRGHR